MVLRSRIPFHVPPYPDELLGSWLHRLQLHNHSSLLLQQSGVVNRQRLDKSEWRDMPKRKPALDQLLGALDITYDTAMMELTTYPYWLRFHSSSAFDWQTRGSELPALILKGRRQALIRLSYLLPNLMRICPICLAEDIEQYGEPYAHRAHLLPYVRVCHKHCIELISRCPRCGQIFRMNSTFINTRVVCTCKFDLRCSRGSTISASQDVWQNLARYSADALFYQENFHECSSFYKFLDARLTKHGVAKRPDLLAYLSDFYSPDAAKAMLCLSRQHSDAYTFAPIGWVSRRELRAPPICAFLSTLDSSFAHSQALFAHFMTELARNENGRIRAHHHAKLPFTPTSVREARAYVAEVEQYAGRNSITRSFLYQRYKKLFWYLVLFDREWFDQQFSSGKRGAPEHLPSIEADRLSILLAIEKAPRHSVKIWANLAQQAYFRASLRDEEWLESRKGYTVLQAQREKFIKQREYLQTCEDEIKRGIERVQAMQGNLFNLSPALIAPYTVLSESQIRHFFANRPEIRQYLVSEVQKKMANH